MRADSRVEGIVFDLAGTVTDFGSCAPVQALQQLFSDQRVPISEEEARRPMGMEKRAHIADILQQESVARRWQAAHGLLPGKREAEHLFREFEPLQRRAVADRSDLVPGFQETAAALEARDVRLGFNTGYSRSMAQPALDELGRRDIRMHSVVCASEVPLGRPAPHMALSNLIEMSCTGVQRCIKVDDSLSGIAEGRNAGMWTIAVAVSGTANGLTLEQWSHLDQEGQDSRRNLAYRCFQEGSAHYIIDSVADLLPVLELIERRLGRGERP